jgi:hypothetical protein
MACCCGGAATCDCCGLCEPASPFFGKTCNEIYLRVSFTGSPVTAAVSFTNPITTGNDFCVNQTIVANFNSVTASLQLNCPPTPLPARTNAQSGILPWANSVQNAWGSLQVFSATNTIDGRITLTNEASGCRCLMQLGPALLAGFEDAPSVIGKIPRWPPSFSGLLVSYCTFGKTVSPPPPSTAERSFSCITDLIGLSVSWNTIGDSLGTQLDSLTGILCCVSEPSIDNISIALSGGDVTMTITDVSLLP